MQPRPPRDAKNQDPAARAAAIFSEPHTVRAGQTWRNGGVMVGHLPRQVAEYIGPPPTSALPPASQARQ